MRKWLRGWLGFRTATEVQLENKAWKQALHTLQNEIRDLRAEVARLKLERYVPPSQPEPERKVIQTRTFKQYTDIVEQEAREREMQDAL